MNTKHTPGPWVTFPADVGSVACPVGTRVLKYGHHPIADAFFGYQQGMPSYDEAKANARLIAAAPDLLEALTFARKFHAMKCEKGDSGFPAQLVETIDDAIAKATGDAP